MSMEPQLALALRSMGYLETIIDPNGYRSMG